MPTYEQRDCLNPTIIAQDTRVQRNASVGAFLYTVASPPVRICICQGKTAQGF
jgi:hypothetical protein